MKTIGEFIANTFRLLFLAGYLTWPFLLLWVLVHWDDNLWEASGRVLFPAAVVAAAVSAIIAIGRWGSKNRTRPTGRRDRTTRPPETPAADKYLRERHVWVTEPPRYWVERRYDKAKAQRLCPTPNKMFIGTRASALRQAKEKSEKYGDLQRAYPCDCSWWHLTTMSEITVGRNGNDDVGREHGRAIGSEAAARLRMPGVKAPWVALVLVPLWIIVSLAFIAITERNRGEPALPVDIFLALLWGAICVWMVVGVPLLFWLDRKRRKQAGTVKVPWEAPKTDEQGRVHTQRGYWAKRGSGHQHKIDKYEQMIMAPLTREEKKQFRLGRAWLAAWLPIGIVGSLAGVLIAESVADNPFVRFFTGAIGLAVILVSWATPIVKAKQALEGVVESIRDAREDAFEEWRLAGSPRRSTDDDDYGDGTNRTYPVTDGVYNPELYSERGGYSTYQAMERWNVDDYDTYKSNIE